jgi:hypothetical protein
MTVNFQLDGQEFIALNGGPQFKFTQAISFSANCETQEEVDIRTRSKQMRSFFVSFVSFVSFRGFVSFVVRRASARRGIGRRGPPGSSSTWDLHPRLPS